MLGPGYGADEASCISGHVVVCRLFSPGVALARELVMDIFGDISHDLGLGLFVSCLVAFDLGALCVGAEVVEDMGGIVHFCPVAFHAIVATLELFRDSGDKCFRNSCYLIFS